MLLVMACWLLAMISGLCWARWWTGVFTVVTAAGALWVQAFPRPGAVDAAVSGAFAGWVQLGVLTLTPWLLAFQQGHREDVVKTLHAEEAETMAGLSDAARRLLSVQAKTQQLEAQIASITDVYHVTKETGRALHLAELFSASLEIAPRLLDARGLRLITLSGEAPQILRAARSEDGRMILGDTNHVLDMERAIIKHAVSSVGASIATAQQLACPLPEGLSRVAWAPLWRDQKPIGVLVADELPEAQLKMLSIMANQLSLQLSRIRLYEQVESLAVTDALTGISVRRHVLERAEEELLRSQRHGLACTLLMVDLDLFKEKNDTYGHLVGDVVLKDVARLLSRNLREIDLMGRYGGEEFIILLIETEAEQAMPIAQRLRQLVEVHPIRAYDELLTQTISIGVAAFPKDAQSLHLLIERADQALYAAKRSGRNRVMRWTSTVTS